MKRGNFSVIALGVFFLLFMVFVLFYKPSITSSVTGYFVFDPKEVVVTNISIPLSGNFSFTIEDKDGDTMGILNITNTSFIRVLILTPGGKIQDPNDVWKTFEGVAEKTTPKIEFNDYATYKIPKAGTYKVDIKEFGIIPANNGTYKLIFDIWYDLTKRKDDGGSELTRKELAIEVNLSAPYVPPQPNDNTKVNKVYILGGELNKDGSINRTRTNFIIGEALLCYVNFTNKTGVNMTFKYYKKSDLTIPVKTIMSYECNASDLCFGKYVVDKFEDTEAKCIAELNNSLGNFASGVSGYIKIVNRPPVLTSDIPDIEIAVGEDYVLDLSDYFSDPEGDNLNYDALGTLHAFMNITGSDVTISGAQAYDGVDVLVFRAIDSKGTFVISNNVSVNYNGTASVSGCKTDWSCTEFSACVDGYRTRICTDNNECDVLTGKPVEQQKCTAVGDAGSEESAQTGNDKSATTPLTKLQQPETSNTMFYVVLIIVVVLALAGGGGAIYYFKFYKKTDEEGEEKKEEKKEEVIGGVTGESTLYKPAENKAVVQTSEQAKPAETQPVAVSNVDEIYKYFEQAADLGKAKDELLAAGWDKKDVQRAFDVVTLRRYVAEKIKSGFDKEKLKESLKSRGWKQDIIDDVFK